MLVCNLPVVLAERGLKITKVSKETGISRTTLTDLAKGRAQGIQLETLNTLCVYLKVQPSDIFSVLPYDIFVRNVWAEYKAEYDTPEDITPCDLIIGGFTLVVVDGAISHSVVFGFEGFATYYGDKDGDIFHMEMIVPETPESESTAVISKYYNSIPITFRRSLIQKIEYQVKAALPMGCDEVQLNERLDEALENKEI